MLFALALAVATELPEADVPGDEEESRVPSSRGDDDEARRARAMRLLEFMREQFIASDLRRAWATAAASSDPADEAAVEAALADVAVLKLGPAAVKARLKGEPATSAAAGPAGGSPVDGTAASATPAPPPPAEPVLVDGIRLATEGGLLQATLDSGLRVVIVGDPVLRTTAIVHQVNAGGAADAVGKEGTAHLVEHLLFEGADPSGTFTDNVDAEGGWANAWTSYDQTLYLTSVLPASLRGTLALEGRRFTRPLDSRALEQERAVVRDELRLRAGLEPGARMVAGLQGALAAGHAYGRPLGGDDQSLTAISVADVEAFYQAHYSGANLRLVIVGPHDPREVLPLVKAAYGSLSEGVAAAPPETLPSLDREPIILDIAGMGANYAGRAWRVPASGACIGAEDFDACLRQYWTGQVSLALLESGGARAMSDALMAKTLLATPVDVGHWAGTAGGYVYALALRRPEGLIVLQNVGSVTLAVVTGALGVLTILAGVWLPPVIIPLEHNPTPRMVDRVMAADEGEWVSDEAIRRTRRAVLFDELARTWSAEARAMAIADRMQVGMDPSEAVSTQVGRITPEEVRAHLDALFQRPNGVNVSVR